MSEHTILDKFNEEKLILSKRVIELENLMEKDWIEIKDSIRPLNLLNQILAELTREDVFKASQYTTIASSLLALLVNRIKKKITLSNAGIIKRIIGILFKKSSKKHTS